MSSHTGSIGSKTHNGSKKVKRFLQGVLPQEEEVMEPAPPPLILPVPEADSVYEETVKAPVINMKRVRQLAFRGVPKNLRGIYWKLLLGYLPPEREQWSIQLQNQRNAYHTLLSVALSEPRNTSENDHPLSNERNSGWYIHFKDIETKELIQRDVARTMPEERFFCTPEKTNTIHGTALNNMLLVYAKNNARIGYVQGMNEVMAQIYYVFINSENEDERKHAEEDAFSCFAMLMGEISDTFNKELDCSMLDAFNTIGRYQSLLAIIDPELYLDMKMKNLDPRFYALRWLSLLFSQEYPVSDVQRLWDTLLSDENRFNFLLFFACSLVLEVRDDLIQNEFSRDLMILQNLPPPVMDEAIFKAELLAAKVDPAMLDPTNMTAYMRQLHIDNAKPPTGQDLLDRADKALQKEIQERRNRKKPSNSSESIPAEIVMSKATPRQSIPGRLPDYFCTLPWHK